jgi:hypothetical protein
MGLKVKKITKSQTPEPNWLHFSGIRCPAFGIWNHTPPFPIGQQISANSKPTQAWQKKLKTYFYRDEQDIQDKIKVVFGLNPRSFILFILIIPVNFVFE